MNILELKGQVEKIKENAVCRVYAVSYDQKGGQDNRAIAMSEQAGEVLIKKFWKSIFDYDENVTNLVEVSGGAVTEKWGGLGKLLQNAVAYESGNIEEIRGCSLYVCEAKYGSKRYYFCARQNSPIQTLRGQEMVILDNNGELVIQSLKNVRLMRTTVDFVIDMEEKRMIFLDSKSYEEITRGDDVKEVFVRKNLKILDNWKFIANVSFIKERVFQKNVYSNLYKIFNRQEEIERIKQISPTKFKRFLTHEYSKKFAETDFKEDKLIITRHNMEAVFKILAKGIDFMWLEMDHEQSEDRNDDDNVNENEYEDETVLPMRTIKMCQKVGYGFVLNENEQKTREEQIRHFLLILHKACESDLPGNHESAEHEANKTEKQTTGIFDYFKSNDVKLDSYIRGKETWFEKNEADFQKIYADDDERELLIKGLCKDRFFNLLLSHSKKIE